MRDQAEGLRKLMKNGKPERINGRSLTNPGNDSCPRVFSIASGKGGVGKTNVVANLAFALTRLGKRIMVLDADLGLANIDVLLGLTPRYTIEHFLDRSKTFSEILMKGPGGMFIIPASSGVFELVDLKDHQKLFLLNEIDTLADKIDILLIDTAAGISSNVLYFNMAAQESIILVTPEPTSITDAYALIKVLYTKFKKDNFMILVNLVSSESEARDVFRKISLVADRFLNHLSIDYLGFVPFDEKVPLAVKQQRAVLELYPNSPASRHFMLLAKRLMTKPAQLGGKGQIQFFWKQLLRCEKLCDQQGKAD